MLVHMLLEMFAGILYGCYSSLFFCKPADDACTDTRISDCLLSIMLLGVCFVLRYTQQVMFLNNQPSTSHALNGAGVAQERRTVPVEDVEKASRAKLYCGEIRRAMSCPRLQRQSLYDRLGDVDCFAIVRWQIYMCTTPYAERA